MPRYYFNLHDRSSRPDTEGAELPDRQSVRAEAITIVGAMLREVDGPLGGEEWSMDVTNEFGDVVLALRFSAMEPED